MQIFQYTFTCMHIYVHAYTYSSIFTCTDTGWRRLIGSRKMQIIFHKRATKYRSLLQKMTYKNKGSYESSPSSRWMSSGLVCTNEVYVCVCVCVRVRVFACVCVYTCKIPGGCVACVCRVCDCRVKGTLCHTHIEIAHTH